MAFTESTETKLLLAKIAVAFPSVNISKYQHIKHGYDHDILIIDDWVYRFPKTEYYLKQLETETKLTSYLSTKVDISVPIYDYIAKDFSFARHKFIKGVEVIEDTFKRLSNTEKKSVTIKIASFLSVLHNIPNSKYKEFGFMDNKNNPTLGEGINYVPTHSDLDINNMIWDNTGGLGIIDFGDRCLFDPAYDFTVFPMFGKSFLNDIYRKYTGKKDPNFLNRINLYYNQYCSNKS